MRAKEEIKRYYDSLAVEKNADIDKWLKSGDKRLVPETKCGNYFIDRKLQTSLRMARLGEKAHILEIGCQYGYFTFRLADLGFNITAVDLSERTLEMAKKRAQHHGLTNINFIKADAEDLHVIRDNTFDAVFSFSCLRYLPDPSKALTEIYRVLRPSGKIIADFPNKYSPWFNIIKPAMGIKPHMHDRLYSAPEVKRLVSSAGFKAVKTAKILFTPRKAPSSLLPFFKFMDFAGERIYGLRELAAIILCRGEKQ